MARGPGRARAGARAACGLLLVGALGLGGLLGAPGAAAAARAADGGPVPVPTEPTPAPGDPTPVPTGPTPVPTPVPTPPPSAPPTPTPTPLPAPLPTALGSWCSALFPPLSASTTKRKAQQLLAGVVDLGRYGSYRLGDRPDWRPQSSADTAGNRHIHSLNWALPLLYQGVRAQNRAMVERFTTLLRWWVDDHRVPAVRGYWVNASIYGGLRTQTLVCAAQTLGDPQLTAAALGEAGRMLATFTGPGSGGAGTDNTVLIRQTGAFAAYCWSGDLTRRDQAWANLAGVADALVQPDGSDVEGSPAYAVYTEEVLRDVEASAAVCGTDPAPVPQLRQRLYAFVVQALRPDLRLESLGDGVAAPLPAGFGRDDPAVQWARSGGTTGTAPTTTYATFAGGYAFGRSAWAPPAAPAPDSFWSLRFTSARPATAHVHDDGGALTFWSRGTSWVGDPGPYRYETTSALRRFVRTRSAHSSITVSGVTRSSPPAVRLVSTTGPGTAGSAAADDVACTEDRSWATVRWTRCVRYARAVDALVVTDTVRAAAIVPPRPRPPEPGGRPPRPARVPDRVVTQRWQLPNGVTATPAGSLVTLTAVAAPARVGSAVDVVADGPGGWSVRPARSGDPAGWFTAGWGEKVRGSVLSRQARFLAAGGTVRWTTVLLARGAEEQPAGAALDPGGVTVTRGGSTIRVPR